MEQADLAVVDFERRVRTGAPVLGETWQRYADEGRRRMHALAKNAESPSWPGATSASALRRAAEDAELAALLDDYAREALPEVPDAEAERWRALLAEERQRRGGLLFEDLARSTVGAVSLYLEFGRLTGLRRATCDCGFAVDGSVPERLCDDCDETILRRWVAEDRRLLRAVPGYAGEVTAVIARAAARQSTVIDAPGDAAFSEAAGVRRAAGRALRRLARRHRAEQAPSERWQELAELSARSPRTGLRADAKKAARRGLGAAGLAELAVRADDELWKAMTRMTEQRSGRRS